MSMKSRAKISELANEEFKKIIKKVQWEIGNHTQMVHVIFTLSLSLSV
jgi:hypothetical protein